MSVHTRLSELNFPNRVILLRPIVHRAGGMLLQAKKEFALCGDLRPDDVFFYYTTTLVLLTFRAFYNCPISCPMTLTNISDFPFLQGMDDVEFPCRGPQYRLHSCVIRRQPPKRCESSLEVGRRIGNHYLWHECEIS